jgi:hypothetical protein
MARTAAIIIAAIAIAAAGATVYRHLHPGPVENIWKQPIP